MQNEFEKQVQQKMEELKMAPSKPVWEKVEMQIRKKKERRRLFFLLPVFLLLIAGGIWIRTQSSSSKVSLSKTEKKKETINQSAKGNLNKTAIRINTHNLSSDTNFTETAIVSYKKEDKLSKRKIAFEKSSSDQNQKNKSKKEDLSTSKEQKQLNQQKTTQISNKNSEENTNRVNENNYKKIDDLKTSAVDTTTTSATSNSFINNETKDEVSSEKTLQKKDTTQSDSSRTKKSAIDSIPKPILKKQSKAWKYDIVANAGLSGLGRVNFYNGEKSLLGQLSSSPGSGGGSVYSGASSVKKDLAFSIGLLKQKQLEKRLSFSVGLQYNYYSNSILVGTKVQRDTVFKNLYSVSQFFTNSPTPSTSGGSTYSISLQSYKNHYHFISLPLTMDWQMFRNFPLNFHAGVSLQQMIQTNALIFDYSSQAYYHSNKVFNKTQLFTGYGLSYSIPLNKQVLTVGPQLQYALSSVEKNNSDHHLFSYGLKAQLQLNKK